MGAPHWAPALHPVCQEPCHPPRIDDAIGSDNRDPRGLLETYERSWRLTGSSRSTLFTGCPVVSQPSSDRPEDTPAT